MADVKQTASSNLPTHWGAFQVIHFVDTKSGEEALALVRGELSPTDTLCRVHSECMTGEVFGSLRCDCRPQLELALEKISRAKSGVLVYLRQEGRGIGLANKIRAYALQDEGRDTVQANEELGFAADERQYEVAASILRALGVESVRLMTNNPDKISGLKRAGIDVVEQLSHWAGASAHSEAYLQTKQLRMGHIVPRDDQKG
jgi:GTP cyclohydrolase II